MVFLFSFSLVAFVQEVVSAPTVTILFAIKVFWCFDHRIEKHNSESGCFFDAHISVSIFILSSS